MSTPDRSPARTRRVIPTTCSVHGGSRGFTNLVVSRLGGEIVLDPHATGSCVIVLDKAAASQLFATLRDWLE
jgi:hypothetical protein